MVYGVFVLAVWTVVRINLKTPCTSEFYNYKLFRSSVGCRGQTHKLCACKRPASNFIHCLWAIPRENWVTRIFSFSLLKDGILLVRCVSLRDGTSFTS